MRRIKRLHAFNFSTVAAKNKICSKSGNKIELETLIKVSGLEYVIGFNYLDNVNKYVS